jgi:tetratricopeptide (TPR) repeat protein
VLALLVMAPFALSAAARTASPRPLLCGLPPSTTTTADRPNPTGPVPAGAADVGPSAPTPIGPSPTVCDVADLPAGGPIKDLTADIEVLPLLVDDVVDQPSQAALARYRQAGVLDTPDVRAAFEAAWAALVVPPDAAPQIATLGTDLLAGLESITDLRARLDDVLDPLVADVSNRDRLTNAAVVLFSFGALVDTGLGAPPPDIGSPEFYGASREDAAIAVLESTGRVFGATRETTLDLAYFVSVTDTTAGLDRAVEQLDPQSGDVTALLLLASLQSRQVRNSRGYEDALATLAPLVADPDTEALGRAARGDAYLAAASIRATDAPRTAKVLAARAVAEYDTALGRSSDPGLFAGRARALARLGDLAHAQDAMSRAVALAPESVDFRIELAALSEAAGDPMGMRTAARTAFGMATAGWNPSASAVRLVLTNVPGLISLAAPGDLGFLGASIGSDRDHVGLARFGQGGGGIIGVDVVPKVPDPATDDWRRGGVPADVAASMAIAGSGDLNQADSVEDDFAAWQDGAPNLADQLPRLLGGVRGPALLYAEAARVMTGATTHTDAFGDAEVIDRLSANYRRIGRFDTAETLCDHLRDTQPLVPGGPSAARCIGDAQYLQGRLDDAAATYAAGQPDTFVDGPLALRQGAAALLADHPDEARPVLRRLVVGFADERIPAMVLLGDIEFLAGGMGAANAYYDLALDSFAGIEDENRQFDLSAVALARALEEHTRNNRGVALLRLAQTDATRPPSCATEAELARCRAAESDLELAIEIDPLNAVAHMNLGWAARSLDKRDEAIAALTTALDADRALFPAANDLGVLEAQAGHGDRARHAFHAAMAADPRYALAWFNLGVLELRSGPGGLRAGQAALARATKLDSSLAGAPVEFRTDESVYKVTFGGLENVSRGWPVGRTYGAGAALLGGIGLVTAIGRFGNGFLGGAWERLVDLLMERRDKSKRLARATNRVAGLRRRLPSRARPFVPWAGTGVALAGVTGLSIRWHAPSAALATFAAAVLATASALALHEAAHAVAAHRRDGRLTPAAWTPGVVLALLLLPVRVSSGPYFTESFTGVAAKALWRVHLAGPLANLAAAAVAYAAFLAHPAPLLLLTSQVQLAVCAYSLLPNAPLDGKPILERSPWLSAGLNLMVTAAGAAFALGAL